MVGKELKSYTCKVFFFSDIKDKGLDDDSSQSVPAEESTQFSSASSHGRRIHWLLSSASLGNIDEDTELSIGEPRLESSASGATLEVKVVAVC